MSDLLALAERCEAATGPDRELDISIKAALYGGVALKSPFNGEWCVYRVGTDDPRTGKTVERPRNVAFEQWSADRYTASIDAAMTLVEGMNKWAMTASSNGDRWEAWVWEADVPPNWHNAATPALALVTAALRARAASTPPARPLCGSLGDEM